MLPGVASTNKRGVIARVVIGFRDGKGSFEDSYWDQASVLVQLGLLPGTLSVESVRKLQDFALPANGLIRRGGAERTALARRKPRAWTTASYELTLVRLFGPSTA